MAKPRRAGEIEFFAWIRDGDIPRDRRRAVRALVNRAAGELGLGRLAIRWFAPPRRDRHPDFWAPVRQDDELFLGLAPPDHPLTVAFNAELRGDALVGVVAHEVRHVWQAAVGMPTEQRHADTDRYMAAFVERLRAG
jgi:hypothetical protein